MAQDGQMDTLIFGQPFHGIYCIHIQMWAVPSYVQAMGGPLMSKLPFNGQLRLFASLPMLGKVRQRLSMQKDAAHPVLR